MSIRRIPVTREFYSTLVATLEDDEQTFIEDGEIGMGLVLLSTEGKKLIFYELSPAPKDSGRRGD